jgi:hypothetical protein
VSSEKHVAMKPSVSSKIGAQSWTRGNESWNSKSTLGSMSLIFESDDQPLWVLRERLAERGQLASSA